MRNFLRSRRPGVVYPLASPSISLLPLKSRKGAALAWTFEQNPESAEDWWLLVELTNQEAEKVADTDLASVGVLENVRRNLEHRVGWIVGAAGEMAPFVIKQDWTENELVDELFEACEDPDAYTHRLIETGALRLADPEVVQSQKVLTGVLSDFRGGHLTPAH